MEKPLKKITENHTISKLVKTSDKEGKKPQYLQWNKDKNDSRLPIRNDASQKTWNNSYLQVIEENMSGFLSSSGMRKPSNHNSKSQSIKEGHAKSHYMTNWGKIL